MYMLRCVTARDSRAALLVHKEPVFRGIQCGHAWHCGVKLPVKTTVTGTGHRQQQQQQQTWWVTVSFLTTSAPSVCPGWRWWGRTCEHVSSLGYFWKPHGTRQHVHLHTWQHRDKVVDRRWTRTSRTPHTDYGNKRTGVLQAPPSHVDDNNSLHVPVKCQGFFNIIIRNFILIFYLFKDNNNLKISKWKQTLFGRAK